MIALNKFRQLIKFLITLFIEISAQTSIILA